MLILIGDVVDYVDKILQVFENENREMMNVEGWDRMQFLHEPPTFYAFCHAPQAAS